MFSIATWNINSLRVRLPHVLQWLQSNPVDVLALQEIKMVDEDFPKETFEQAGYHALFSGQKTYNGVAILSKVKPELPCITRFPDLDDPQKRILGTGIHGIYILNLYVPNGSEVGSDKYLYKLTWLNHLNTFTEQLIAEYEKVILLGDFNIAPGDIDVHDPEEWAGSVLVSDQEREKFQHLLDKGLYDSFRLCKPEQQEFSWWDYRAASFRRNRGLRIDHILISDALRQVCTDSRIDKAPRKLERPSDHTPLITDFDL